MISARLPACVVLFALITAALAAQTADRARAEAQAQRVNDRIRALEAEADRLAGQARTLLGDLRKLEVEQRAADRACDARRRRRGRARPRRDRRPAPCASQSLEAAARRHSCPICRHSSSTSTSAGAAVTRGCSSVGRRARFRPGDARRRRDDAHQRAARRRASPHARRAHGGSAPRLEDELRALQAREAEALQARAAADRALAARSALDRADRCAPRSQRAVRRRAAGRLRAAAAAAGRLGGGAPAEPIAIPLAPFRGALDWPAPGRIAVRFGQRPGAAGRSTSPERHRDRRAGRHAGPCRPPRHGVLCRARSPASATSSSSTTANNYSRYTATWRRLPSHGDRGRRRDRARPRRIGPGRTTRPVLRDARRRPFRRSRTMAASESPVTTRAVQVFSGS